ncbi:hypothetical protein GCM10010104_28010 [Streptomyces indiaensis]|uniref:Uncharacterized protein n=2 Tax=Streptomyces TaxID=1883 RepID=A0ABN3DJB4_9ACTN
MGSGRGHPGVRRLRRPAGLAGVLRPRLPCLQGLLTTRVTLPAPPSRATFTHHPSYRTGEPAMSDNEPDTSTEVLQHTVVERLMAVIGAPDDEDVARDADAAVLALDERLRAESAA